MAQQLNIFVENKPGRIRAVTGTLEENDINLRSFQIQDRDDFGVMKALVDKPDLARTKLTEAGFACALKDIVAVKIKDTPGELDKLLNVLFDQEINISDSYGFALNSDDSALICLEVSNNKRVTQILKETDFILETNAEISNI